MGGDMVILPNSCFLHVPKTGGSWIKAALKASGMMVEEFEVNGDPHAGLTHCPCPEKFKFAFVRHPVDHYRSYWQYKMGRGWDFKNPIDRNCCAANFSEFINNILTKFPGVYSKAIEEYVGPPEAEIEFIGKYENLVEDLILALNQAGEPFDEPVIRKFPPVNVSDRVRFPAEYSLMLEKAVRESENIFIRRFGYK